MLSQKGIRGGPTMVRTGITRLGRDLDCIDALYTNPIHYSPVIASIRFLSFSFWSEHMLGTLVATPAFNVF